MPPCKCSALTYESSSYASKAGFIGSTNQELIAASGRRGNDECPDPRVFPAPLVLPEDDLAWEPDETGQSVAEWRDGEHRNPVTKKRNVIYIAAPPIVDPEVGFVSSWSEPIDGSFETLGTSLDQDRRSSQTDIKGVADYISAFYHGLAVKVLPKTFRFMAWKDTKPSRAKSKSGGKSSATEPQYIGLSNSKECVRIETRPSNDGIFRRQLSLNDIIDAEISMLPKDAYALTLLVDHDMYESEDDDFACGRAYGGSRIAVISTARYNPILDFHQNVDRRHAWPASHCEQYVKECCDAAVGKPRKKKAKVTKSKKGSTTSSSHDAGFPVREALNTYIQMLSTSQAEPDESSSTLWLGRVCRTVSHELGHCFGIAHCPYYACATQSTASLAEDVRQPPYLCPVDEEKILQAINSDSHKRDLALLEFCDRYKSASLFAAYGSWIKARLNAMEAKAISKENEVIWISP